MPYPTCTSSKSYETFRPFVGTYPLIVTGSSDGTARVWDAGSGRCLIELRGHSRAVRSVAFSPDGKLIVTGSSYGTARVWDASSGRSLFELRGHSQAVRSVAFSPDGKLIVTGSDDRAARIWKVSAETSLESISKIGSE